LEKAEDFFTIRKESREIIFGGLRLRRRKEQAQSQWRIAIKNKS
jgi:hypothetical protein